MSCALLEILDGKGPGYAAKLFNLPDLTKPIAIEQYIRHPEETSEYWAWMNRMNKQAFEDRIRRLPLAERSQAICDEKRLREREERERFCACVKGLIAKGSPFDYRILFPNLHPTKIHPNGWFEYSLESDSALVWDQPQAQSLSLSLASSRDSSPSATNHSGSSHTRHAYEVSDQILCQQKVFRPSYQSLNQKQVMTAEDRRRLLEAGVDLENVTYQGAMGQSFLENFMVPDAWNCSVYITGIPRHASQKDIFSAIFEGGIQKFSLQHAVGNYQHQAASLSFKEPIAAHDFLARCQQEGVWIHDQRVYGVSNRDKVKPLQHNQLHQSRVLLFTIPEYLQANELVNNIKGCGIVFTLVDCQEWKAELGTKRVELSFGSIQGQSRQVFRAFKILAADPSSVYHGCFVDFAPDPCDPESGCLWNGLQAGSRRP